MYLLNSMFFLADGRTFINISKEFDLDKALYEPPGWISDYPKMVKNYARYDVVICSI